MGRNAQQEIMYGEAFAYHERDLQTRPQVYGKWTRRQLRRAVLYTAADYVQAQRVRTLLKQEVASALADVDVLVMPTSQGVASAFEGYDPDNLADTPSYMSIWNVTGSPALSVCCGFSQAKLPIGMQIVGKPFDEPTMLKVADAYQRVTDWHTRMPNVQMEVTA